MKNTDKSEPQNTKPSMKPIIENVESKDGYYDNLGEFFPFKSQRPIQEQSTDFFKEHLQDPNINVIYAELATGVGKSPLAVMLARHAKGRSYAMTANKALQVQYMRDFSDYLAELKGRSNYQCNRYRDKEGNYSYNCDNSPCQENQATKKDCGAKKGCEYHRKLAAASEAQTALFNFASGFYQLKYNGPNENNEGYFQEREVLIVDEAHLIVDQMTGMGSIEISPEKFNETFEWQPGWDLLMGDQVEYHGGKPKGWIEQIEQQSSFEDWVRFLRRVSHQVDTMLEKAMCDDKSKKFLESFNNKLETLDMIIEYAEDNIKNFDPDAYFVYGMKDVGTYKKPKERLVFQPVDVKAVFDFFRSKCDKIILLSATFCNIPMYNKMLGIKEGEYKHVYAASPFPLENRPIRISQTVGVLGRKNPQNQVKMLNSIQAITKHFSDKKGIIHTPSYKLAEYIYENSEPQIRERLLFPRNSAEKDQMMKIHTENMEFPSILMSPSMREGIDLKDDLARFQIISKMPWPNFGDELVKKRDAMYPGYINLNTILSLVQSVGRTVRNENDHCITFVLDYAFRMLYERNKNMFPPDFHKTIHWK